MRWGGWSGRVGLVGATVLGLTLLGLATKADTHLADGGNPGVIHACMKIDDGKVKIIKPLKSCQDDETTVHWVATLGSPFIDLGLVVLDIRTGLMWEKKTTMVGSGANLSDLHDVDNTYTWCAATGDATAGTFCQGNTTSWIAQVNAEAFAGFTDWRLPTGGADGGELATILLAPFPCATSPCIDPIFGPTASSFYWSATEFDPVNAWFVDFANGLVFIGSEDYTSRVRALRGGP